MARTPRWLPLLCVAAFAVALAVPADPAFAKTVRIPKKGAKCADDPGCHNRWHPDIKPAATADPGDTVVFGTREAAEAERFLAEHGHHPRAETVRFFLAVDHYRIARHVTDPSRRAEHARRARHALQQTVERSAQPFDVRAAQTLLERLGR